MSKTLRKVLSMVCAITLVVSSMTGLELTNVSADTTTTVITTSEVDARTALIAEVASADYNFTLGKNASVSQLTSVDGGTNLEIITNGSFATANNKDTIIEIGRGNSADFAWVQVDLGNAYDTSKINRVAVQYKTNGTSPRSGYTISYSLNGIDFVTVAEVGAIAGGANQIYLDEISLTAEQAEAIPYAKYVRVTSTKVADTSAYGMQVKGMAVLTDGITKVSDVEYQEVEKLDAPESVTVTSSTYGQLEFSFEAASEDDGYTYYAYVDGAQYSETVVPGTTYTIENLAAGEHKVKVISFKDGLTSDEVTGSVTVSDTKSLLTSERNIATGKTASASSIRESDQESAVTDGVLNVLFRTSTTETTANVVIDLGQNYRLDAIERTVSLFADNRYPTEYTVDFSLNGVVYQTVATATGNGALQTTTVDVSECTLEAVRYVRFSFDLAVQLGYGFQMYELGVIAKEGADLTPVEVEKVVLDEPASLTVTSSDYCQLEYTFEAAEGHDDYEYYAFVNGAKVNEPVIPGETYTVTGLTSGEHTVKVVSFYGGNISEGATGTVDVKDYATLFGDERNIAVGKSVTATSIREEETDIPANVTDGNLTNMFRTATGDATASVVIDLGAVYKAGAIERVVVMFVDYRYAQDYTVECSLDGEKYEQIGSASGIAQSVATAKCEATQIEMTEAQYIRITFSNAISNYGFQIREIAVVEEFTPITEAEVSVAATEYYTGEAIEPEITLTYKEKQLVINKDYELEYSNNTAVGTATVKINGLGRYTGSIEKTFEIVKQDVSNVTVDTSFDEENELVVNVTNGNTAMVVDVDYTCQVGTDDEGNVTVTVEGIGDNYTGEYTKTIPLSEVPVNEAVNVAVTSSDLNTIDVEFSNPDKLGGASQTYNIYIDDELVDEDVEAGAYAYDEQTVGTHTVKVVAVLAGKTSAGVSNDIEVEGMDLSSEAVNVWVEEIVIYYTGSEIPFDKHIGVEYGEIGLQQDVDYKVELEDNINAGTGKYKITGIGLYQGSIDGTFEINKVSLTDECVDLSFNTNKELVVEVLDKINNITLVEGVDYNYTVVTDADYNVTVTVTFLEGNYTGSAVTTIDGNNNPNKPEPTTVAPTTQAPTTVAPTTTAKIKKPAQVKIKKVKKAGKKKVKVSWKKIKGAKGYQIRYSTSKKFKKATKKLIKKNKTTYTIKKLKNKKYYIQVRAYVVKNGKKYYGKWSKRKSIEITK